MFGGSSQILAFGPALSKRSTSHMTLQLSGLDKFKKKNQEWINHLEGLCKTTPSYEELGHLEYWQWWIHYHWNRSLDKLQRKTTHPISCGSGSQPCKFLSRPSHCYKELHPWLNTMAKLGRSGTEWRTCTHLERIDSLSSSVVSLTGPLDSLIWSFNPTRIYTLKQGYLALILEHIDEPAPWWGSILWKLHSPPKQNFSCAFSSQTKLSLGIIYRNTSLWGLIIAQYANRTHRTSHICSYLAPSLTKFGTFSPPPFPFLILGMVPLLRMPSKHVSSHSTSQYKSLPLIVTQGIWISRNHAIF